MSLRLVMMGTGTFALPTFRSLLDSRHDVAGLFTQPDRRGRGHHHHPHPMKDAALAGGVPVFQPERVNRTEALDDLRRLDADVFVVAAYGQILSAELLSIPRLGAINVHASLLPKYRGAAPIQYAILHGETETGITIFRIEPQLDAGPMLAARATSIGAKETAGELEERLADLAAPLVLNVLDGLEQGAAAGQPQDASAVTKAPRLKKEDGAIDWSKSAVEIERQVRAMQPWPAAFTFVPLADRPPLRLIVTSAERRESSGGGPPGSILPDASGERLIVQTGAAALELVRVKPEGRREMSAAEFLHGHNLAAGTQLSSGL